MDKNIFHFCLTHYQLHFVSLILQIIFTLYKLIKPFLSLQFFYYQTQNKTNKLKTMNQIAFNNIVQTKLQRQPASLNISHHLTDLDLKSLHFLFYAQYDIIYQSFEMKSAAYLQKKLVSKSKRQQNGQIERKFQIMSEKNHKKIQRHDSKIDRLLSRLQLIWKLKEIPFFHRFHFQKMIDNDLKGYLESLQVFMMNEQKLIKFQVHIVYSLDRAVKSRQKCLNELKSSLLILNQTDVQEHLFTCAQRLHYLKSKRLTSQYQIQGYKINKVLDRKVTRTIFETTKFQLFGQTFHSLVQLTLQVVGLISKWRRYLYTLTSDIMKSKEQIQYYFQQENYLLRIINDNNFIQKSFLSNYMKFSPKNDPFLLMPLLQIESKNKQIKLGQQNKQTQSLCQLDHLKIVFSPKSQSQLLQMLSKIRILVNQYQVNIKNRKIFDLKIIHKINNLDHSNSIVNLVNNRGRSNLQKSKHFPKKIQLSLVKSRQFKVSKVFLCSKSRNSSLKSLKSPRQLQKQNLRYVKNKKQTQIQPSYTPSLSLMFINKLGTINGFNPEESSKILDKDQRVSPKLMNYKQFQRIKYELKYKIKHQLKQNVKNTIFQKPDLTSYIDSKIQNKPGREDIDAKIKDIDAKIINSTIQDQFSNCLYVETYSVDQKQLTGHLKYLFDQQTLLQFQFIQVYKHQSLVGNGQHFVDQQSLQKLPLLYFLKICIKENQSQNQNTYQKTTTAEKMQQKIVSNVIFTLRHSSKQSPQSRNHQKVQRVIQILHITIKYRQNQKLEKVILKLAEFLFKYQTAESIVFTFYYDKQTSFQYQKINYLKQVLETKNCLIQQKPVARNQIGKKNGAKLKQKSDVTEVRFIFLRVTSPDARTADNQAVRSQNSDYSSLSLYLGLYGLFSMQRLCRTDLQYQNQQDLTIINYDYLLTQIMMNHIDPDHFVALKNNSLWQQRLRVIIENIIARKESNQQMLPFIKICKAQNLSELNRKLFHDQTSIWMGIRDSTKNNFIRMLSLQLNLTLPYPAKAFINRQGRQFFRFQIKSQVQVLKMSYSSRSKGKAQEQTRVFRQEIYMFPSQQKKDVRIGLFDARNAKLFIESQNQKISQRDQKTSRLTLSDLLNCTSFIQSQIATASMKLQGRQTRYLRNLYFPMIGPQRQKVGIQQAIGIKDTIYPSKCNGFQLPSKNQFIWGQNICWKHDLNLQNGVRYTYESKNDLIFQFESSRTLNQTKSNNYMGLALFLVPENIVIYSRIF